MKSCSRLNPRLCESVKVMRAACRKGNDPPPGPTLWLRDLSKEINRVQMNSADDTKMGKVGIIKWALARKIN